MFIIKHIELRNFRPKFNTCSSGIKYARLNKSNFNSIKNIKLDTSENNLNSPCFTKKMISI